MVVQTPALQPSRRVLGWRGFPIAAPFRQRAQWIRHQGRPLGILTASTTGKPPLSISRACERMGETGLRRRASRLLVPPTPKLAHVKIWLPVRSWGPGPQTFSPPGLAIITAAAQRPAPAEGQTAGTGEKKKKNESVSLFSFSVPAVPALSPPLSPFASRSAACPRTRMNAGFPPDQCPPGPACPRVPGGLHTPRPPISVADGSPQGFLARIDPAMLSSGDPSAVFCSAKRSPAPPPPAASRKGPCGPCGDVAMQTLGLCSLALDRYHLCPLAQLVQVVGPGLHHVPALAQVLRAVVGPAQRVGHGMG